MVRLGRARTLLLGTLLGAACAGSRTAPPLHSSPETSMHHARGTFAVRMQPPAPDAGSPFVRLVLDKTFSGGLVGTSRVEMLASNGGDRPSGGYVALERFEGSLDGRAGGFVLQHAGTMTPAGQELSVEVTPGSGTGALEGLAGRMTITRSAEGHAYDLAWSLPGVDAGT